MFLAESKGNKNTLFIAKEQFDETLPKTLVHVPISGGSRIC